MSVQLIDSYGRVVGHAENVEDGVKVVVSGDVDVQIVEADR